MPSRSRITRITAALVFAGAISGASGGAVAMTAAVLAYFRTPPMMLLASKAPGAGALIGARTLPLLGWAFLGDVPLRTVIGGTGIGTAVGATIGLLGGASAVTCMFHSRSSCRRFRSVPPAGRRRRRRSRWNARRLAPTGAHQRSCRLTYVGADKRLAHRARLRQRSI